MLLKQNIMKILYHIFELLDGEVKIRILPYKFSEKIKWWILKHYNVKKLKKLNID